MLLAGASSRAQATGRSNVLMVAVAAQRLSEGIGSVGLSSPSKDEQPGIELGHFAADA
jgi:hypothetical protein